MESISEMTVEQIKAVIYDELCKQNIAAKNIQLLEAELIKRAQEEQPKETVD